MDLPLSAQLVRLAGADARAFAHAQFSSDVRALSPGQWQFSAWLDAAGRVRFLFHLLCTAEDTFIALLRGGTAEAMARQLRMFVLRAKLVVEPMAPATLGDGAPLAQGKALASSEGLRLGCGDHSLQIGGNGQTWRRHQLLARWPWLPEAALGHCLPAWLDLGTLGATALDKGCYPGQEVVARMHYRGGSKRQLQLVRLSRSVPPGTRLRDAEGEWGQLLDAATDEEGCIALAVVRLDPSTALPHDVDVDYEAGRVSVAVMGRATGLR